MIINTSFTQAVQIAVIPPSQQKLNIQLIHRTIVNQVSNNAYIQKSIQTASKNNTVSIQVGINKLVTRKMRVKLINWLQILALETFELSTQTLFEAIRILDHYLAQTNEAPASLQLIGSACLYLSSKISQKKIVAAQCYVTACQEIFTKEQLFQKQMTIFKLMKANPSSYMSFLRIHNFLKNKYLTKTQQEGYQSELEVLLVEFTKKEEYINSQPIRTICLMISFVISQKKVPSVEELISLIKQGLLQ